MVLSDTNPGVIPGVMAGRAEPRSMFRAVVKRRMIKDSVS